MPNQMVFFPPNYAYWHRNIIPTIPSRSWFRSLKIPRHLIVTFIRLRIGHFLLSNHSFRLSLNYSPLCTLHSEEAIFYLNHILFYCPSLLSSRRLLFSLFTTQGYLCPNSYLILNSRSPIIINAIVKFIVNAF